MIFDTECEAVNDLFGETQRAMAAIRERNARE